MLQFITIFRTVIQILPHLITVISILETAVPQGGSGEKKLEALKSILKTVHDASDGASVPFEQLWSVLAPITGVIVTLTNNASTGKQP